MISKINNKIMSLTLFAGSIVSIPVFLASCSTTQRVNFVTTYDNVLDDVIALGIKADYATPGNWTNYTAKYISELANKSGTQILDYRIFPKGGGSLNPKQLSNLNVDLLAANITDSGKESTVKDYINNIAYSGRGDSKEYSYVNDDLNGGIDFYDTEGKRVQIKDNQFVDATTEGAQRYDNQSFLEDYGYSFKLYEWQQNPFAALQLFAKELDNLSSNKNNFYQKAVEIEELQKTRLTELNNQELVKTHINNKSVAFILGKKATSNSDDVASNIQLYSPHTYPQFYSKLDNKGLKMNFPAPSSVADLSSGMFNDPDIIAGDSGSFNTFKNANGGDKLISAFKNKFDYVVYMAYDGAENVHTKDEVINSSLKDLLKTNTNPSTNIFYTSYSDMYMSTWGPIGQSYGITKFVEWINNTFATSSKITENTSDILYNTIDTSTLKSWSSLK